MNRSIAFAFLLLLPFALANAGMTGPLEPEAVTSDEHNFKLSGYNGKWLLVNFWATWCGECVAEMPGLSQFASGTPGVAVIGLTDEKISPQKFEKFLVAHSVSYSVAQVDDRSLPPELSPTAFGIHMRPISYLVGLDGKVTKRFIGAIDYDKIRSLIAAHKP